MVQSGIAYAAGQLLAVVAPRTVLVVDAPTDWSLAGPLWELALDDAPVDEILDVLIRRGIRTAPSFAIVRVENDAVRALVRGSVPVCFERVGEPVRLDATGATTWLEGLISSARRVLVGPVETNSPLPFLVSTGVVLVSGLALPCGPSDRDASKPASSTASSSEPSSEPDSGDSGGGATYFSKPPPAPVAAGSYSAAPGAREPRVVDLTRSGSRAKAKAQAASSAAANSAANSAAASSAAGPAAASASEPRDPWSLASSSGGADRARSQPELNGHAATALDRPLAREATPAETDFRSGPAPVESGSRFEPVDFRSVSADDPGELKDLDSPGTGTGAARRALAEPTRPSLETFYSPPSSPANGYSDLRSTPEPAAARGADPLDDLLRDPTDEEPPRGPSPVDLPNLDPPSMSLPLPGLNGHGSGVPAQPRGFGGAPAAWPPAPEPAYDQYEKDHSVDSGSQYGAAARAADHSPAGTPPEFTWVGPEGDSSVGPSPAEPAAPAASFLPPVLRSEADEQPPLGELPQRVRGRSLRPEIQQPLSESRRLGGLDNVPPGAPNPSFTSGSSFNAGKGNFTDSSSAFSSGGSGSSFSNGSSFNTGGSNSHSSSAADLRGLPSPAAGSLPEPPAPGSALPARPASPSRSASAASSSPASPSASAASPSASNSGGLLLPAFFRGARAARDPDSPDSGPDDQEEQNSDNAAFSPAWDAGPPSAGSGAAWVPPVRRGFTAGSSVPSAAPRSAGSEHEGPEAAADPFDGFEEAMQQPSGGADLGPVNSVLEPLREPPRLLGVWCDAGHVTSPDFDDCRVCGLSVPPQTPILVARPPLGVLVFDNGDRVMIDRPVVIGRDPKKMSSADPEAPVLHAVPSATGQVSRTHAEIRASGWDVVLTDLGAMNGTAVTLPGQDPVAIESGTPTTLSSGARVDLGGESGFVFEVEG